MSLRRAWLGLVLISSTAAGQTTLVAHYRLDETSGTVAADSSGNGNDGVYTGGVTLGQAGTCAGSTAVDFDGTTAYVEIPSSPGLDGLTSDFSVAAWVNLDFLGLMRVFANQRLGGAGGSWAFGPWDAAGGLRFTTLGVQDYNQPSGLTVGTWHHIALVFDANFQAEFYLDGVSQGVVGGGAPANNPNTGWFIGVLDLTGIMEFFDGQIDDVQVYSGSATAADMLFLFQNPCATLANPTTSMCLGDGGDQMGCTNCPCGNNVTPGEERGCLNSAGMGTELLQLGTSSITAADLRFEAAGVAPLNTCILISGNAVAPGNPANPCFGMNSGMQSTSFDGLRCVVQGIMRHGIRPSDASGNVGTTTDGWGSPDAFVNFGAFVAGGTKYFQIVYTDTGGSLCQTGLNTSQAMSISLQP